MTVLSTAILNQYWIGTLWPTICLSDQFNENIDMIGCTEQVFFIIVITFKRCMLLELVSALIFSPKTCTYASCLNLFQRKFTPPPSSYPLPPKKERIEQNFYTTEFFKLRFRILHILPFFPNFQISKHPHAIWLSELYACHRKVRYTCQCLILCKFFFSLWNLLHNL